MRFSSISLLCRQGQKQVKFEPYFVLLTIWKFIYATIDDSACLLVAAAAETGLECWFSLRIF
jgi:hypothetical protein